MIKNECVCSDSDVRDYEYYGLVFCGAVGDIWIVEPAEIVLVDRNGNKKIVNKKIYNKRTKKLDN